MENLIPHLVAIICLMLREKSMGGLAFSEFLGFEAFMPYQFIEYVQSNDIFFPLGLDLKPCMSSAAASPSFVHFVVTLH
jgi:hypothetical protein